MNEIDDYKKAYHRQKLAREKAESLLEGRSRELYEASLELRKTYEKLHSQRAQLMQQEKLASIGLLAAGVAHEINNPISFVKSNLQVLSDYFVILSKLLIRFQEVAKKVNTDPDSVNYRSELTNLVKLAQDNDLAFIIQDSLDSIRESVTGAERVEAIVVNLRDYSRSESSRRELCFVNEIIDSVIKEISKKYKYKIRIEKDYGELPQIYAYVGELNQVFINIIVNAIQALSAGETLRIVTRTEGESIRIDFIDSGPGIPKNSLSKVFDPFFTTKDVGEGTGLGLYISHGIVQKHHGTIEAHNNEDKGARFTVTLPIDIRKVFRS